MPTSAEPSKSERRSRRSGGLERERATETDVDARRAIEAVVLAATEPVEAQLLAQLVELPVTRVEALCDELADEYEEPSAASCSRGSRAATGSRPIPTSRAYVERFVLEGQHARLSGPALETLAIVAYKQPISRGQLSAIRGVNVEATLTTLLQRGYVQEVGPRPRPGAAVLYGTTRCSSSGSGSTRSPTCRRSATSCPTRRWWRRSSAGLRISDDPQRGRDDASPKPTGRGRRRRRPPTPTDRGVAERARRRAAPEGPGPRRASARAGCATS